MGEHSALVNDPNNLEECLPIKSFKDVLKWKEPTSLNWSKFVQPLKERSKYCVKTHPPCGHSTEFLETSKCPKTLVCHDMMGGYLNDRFVSGHNNLDDYKFIRWPCIDTFVYFSHERVTIPPLSWINAGHLHGVKVLGTIITEGKKGESEWKDLTNESYLLDRLAINLTLICKHYGFDGYLLNIENTLDSGFAQGLFKKFVTALNENLKRISQDKMLLWYDSVTVNGDLVWQNRLNHLNKDFFNACDGIFLNYCWKEEALIESLKVAGDRKHDVYVGIDIFGRGCLGGGGFTTCEAFNLIRKYDLSAALFAPGWVHESCPNDENADVRDFMFWNLISEYLYTYGPNSLPFETSFCRGLGYKVHENGLVKDNKPWFNQSKTNHLPAILVGLHGLEEDCCLAYYDKDGFCGGGCLLLTQNLAQNKSDTHIDCLLVCDFSIKSEEEIISIEILTKPLLEEELYEMELIVLTSTLTEVSSTSEDKFRSHCYAIDSKDCLKKNGWNQSTFEVELKSDEHIFNLSCKLIGNKPVLIGYLRIFCSSK